MNPNIAEKQRTIRELSPSYLAKNSNPVGVLAALETIWQQFKNPVEFRKPFVRMPDELDELQQCRTCLGDGQTWFSEDQDYGNCPVCGGKGELEYRDNELFLTVYRDGHSIETFVVVTQEGRVTAWVNVSQPGFPADKEVELTEEEKELARQAIK